MPIGPLPMEIGRSVAEVARQRLLAHDELVAAEPGQRNRLVEHGRHADVEGVDLGQQRFQVVEEGDAAPLGVGPARLAVPGMYAHNLDIYPAHLPQGLEVERGREAGADDSRPHGSLVH